MNILDRAKYVLAGEEGASNLEIIVWMSVVLLIATALFLFKDKIVAFVGQASNKVSTFKVQ